MGDAGGDAAGRLFVGDVPPRKKRCRGSAFCRGRRGRKDRANDASIQKLVKALHTPEVKKFIQDKYKGAIIPAF